MTRPTSYAEARRRLMDAAEEAFALLDLLVLTRRSSSGHVELVAYRDDFRPPEDDAVAVAMDRLQDLEPFADVGVTFRGPSRDDFGQHNRHVVRCRYCDRSLVPSSPHSWDHTFPSQRCDRPKPAVDDPPELSAYRHRVLFTSLVPCSRPLPGPGTKARDTIVACIEILRDHPDSTASSVRDLLTRRLDDPWITTDGNVGCFVPSAGWNGIFWSRREAEEPGPNYRRGTYLYRLSPRGLAINPDDLE